MDLAAFRDGGYVAHHVKSLDELGGRLSGLRRDSGYSYRTLSRETGINPGTLERWEKGRHWPLTHRLSALLHFYGETVTIGWDPSEEL